MNSADISNRLAHVAKRYESNILDLQPLHHFSDILTRCEDQEVFHGLIPAFEESGYEQEGYFRQEVSGRMLVVRRPKPAIDLRDLLTATAPNYNLSVEQFPWYLALVFGRDVLREAIRERLSVSNLPDRERKSLDTYLYWTRISEEQIFREINPPKTEQ